MAAPDPLAAALAAVAARAAAAPGARARRHTLDAFEAYCRLAPAAEPAARGAVAALAARVLRDAAQGREAMRDDPAAPDLDRLYGALLAELSDLAAILSSVEPGTGAVPDPADGCAGEYRGVCAEIRGLMAAAAQAQPAWELVRQSRVAYAAARARPPPRAPPRGPLADDAEYYGPPAAGPPAGGAEHYA